MIDSPRPEWKSLFTGYNCRDGYAEIAHRYYFYRPDKLESPEMVAAEDLKTAQAIRELSSRIAQLQSYRTALQQRYAALAVMDSTMVIRLERTASNGIYYYLITRRRYEDGTERQLSSTRYPGKDRRQAIKDFEALCAANPTAISEKRIEKAAWER